MWTLPHTVEEHSPSLHRHALRLGSHSAGGGQRKQKVSQGGTLWLKGITGGLPSSSRLSQVVLFLSQNVCCLLS